MTVAEFFQWYRVLAYLGIGFLALYSATANKGLMQSYRVIVGIVFVGLGFSRWLLTVNPLWFDQFSNAVLSPLVTVLLVVEVLFAVGTHQRLNR